MSTVRLVVLVFLFLPLLVKAEPRYPAAETPQPKNCILDNVDWPNAAQITVTMRNYKFTPNKITLRFCQPYIFTFINKSRKPHNFVASKFFSTLVVLHEDDRLAPLEGINKEMLELKGGEVAQMSLIPTVAGTYPVVCSHRFHASFGMKGKIEVLRGPTPR